MDGVPPHADESPRSPAGTPCIVLVDRHEHGSPSPDDALDRLLRQRDWTMRVMDDPHDAMVELFLLDTTRRSRSAWGQREDQNASLVIVPPSSADACLAVKQLIEALRRHLPSTNVWLFTGESLAPLARVHAHDDAASIAPARRTRDAALHTNPPPLPLQAPERIAPGAMDVDPDDDPRLVSAAEISMLFGDAEEASTP